MVEIPNSYDALPYESLPRAETHPYRIASIAALLGLSAPPPTTAKILELGCASGGNLLSIADTLPHSECYGIDLSPTQIELGKRLQERAGLKNVTLSTQNIAHIKQSQEFAGKKFDYIICHGVFSWVNAELQESLLAACGNLLSENGIAYISYNVLPGWASVGILRDAMRFAAKKTDAPKTQMADGLRFLSTLAQQGESSEDPYFSTIRGALTSFEKEAPYYIFHEYLEDHNRACYASEFLERASAHDLAYLGDAKFAMMCPADISPRLREDLPSAETDRARYEQALDFFRNRRFRESLMCRKGRTPRFPVSIETLRPFHFASALTPQHGNENLSGEGEEVFTAPNGGEVRVSNSLQKTALVLLRRNWPERIAFSALIEAAAKESGSSLTPSLMDSAQKGLLELLCRCLEANLLEAHLEAGCFTTTISPSPRVSALARAQAELGEHVSSLRHQDVICEPIVRQVLIRLGGKQKPELVNELAQMVVSGQMVIEQNGARITEKTQALALMTEVLDRVLDRLASQAFLLRDD